METYAANEAKKKFANPHDPDAIVDYGFKYKPEIWQAGAVYEESRNVIRPLIDNGFEYHVISNGISGATEPVWPTEKGDTVEDGTVTLKAFNYKSFLRAGETLSGSTWTATESVPIVSDTFTVNGDASVRVGPVPADVEEFELTNHVIENSGKRDDRTLIIKVKER